MTMPHRNLDLQGVATLREIRQALPERYRTRNPWLAWRMLAQSTVTSIAGLLALWWAPWFLDPFLWVYMGFSLFGFLAIGHECGHRALFRRRWMNDALGSVCFLVAFMPYANWMRAHMRHHAHASHYALEEYFGVGRRPARGAFADTLRALLVWMPPVGMAILHLLYMFGLRAKVGRLGHDNLFFNREFNTPLSYANLFMVAATVAVLVGAATVYPWRVLELAVMPMLACCAVNMLIGYMHHQDHDGRIVRFEEEAWTWMKGSLQTVDRTYGPLFDFLIHGAARQHTFHHFFPSLPHAYGRHAMPFIRPLLGGHYRFDPKNAILRFPEAFMNSQVMVGQGRMVFQPAPNRRQPNLETPCRNRTAMKATTGQRATTPTRDP